MTHFIL